MITKMTAQQQFSGTIIEVLSGREYIVKDLVGRTVKAKSDKLWKVGDTVIVQDRWILGKSWTIASVQTFSV